MNTGEQDKRKESKMAQIWFQIRSILKNEDGLGTIELVLLICVLIALALMFKDTIVEFVSDILSNISNQGTVFNPGTIAG